MSVAGNALTTSHFNLNPSLITVSLRTRHTGGYNTFNVALALAFPKALWAVHVYVPPCSRFMAW